MTFEQIKNDENKYMMHTYGRFETALVSGKGAVAKDVEGKEYVDFTSGIGVNCLGYCDEGWVKAVSEQAAVIQHMSNLYYSPLQTELSQKLCELTGLDKVFLCNSGAEANECAIKIARKYSYDKYGEGRQRIVTLVNSFHGRTVTTLAATGQDVFHNFFFPFTEGFAYAKANDFDDLKLHIDDSVCAVFVELVQGEGGVMPLDKEFVDAVVSLCREKDILFMVDEVQTGISRTGAVYCYQNYGIKPDVITSAKGLGGGVPIGACLCTNKLADVMTAGTHGTTFGGNPIACAAAKEVLSRVTSKEFLDEVKKKGDYFREKLMKMSNVKRVTGMGMMIGIETEKDNAKEIAQKCVANGLLILTAKNMLRLLPPLNITYEEIDKGLAILKNIMEA
ncbi:MAG: aspartate aminotransferase family protein [Clostridia bacterium]|nr:aspartate aminotransferase family protein [Clostridia bacterium]